ncbi:MAG: hypothetical protein QM786_00825 [Breznakibacter sp.]
MKTFVLTVELELFFGSDSGTVENSLVRPMRKLLDIIQSREMKITVFWDVMHYYRLCQLAPEVPDLALDKELIENQIRQLVEQGHDIQMHLHPHWLDASWDGYKWIFDYKRYTIQSLEKREDPTDPNTILGCVTVARQTIENLCKEVDPSYKLRAFRAGSNSTIPFDTLGEALRNNHIFIDSSAAKGLLRSNSLAPVDYTWMPDIQYYPFGESPIMFDSNGEFWEFPIETVPFPFYTRFFFGFLEKFKYFDSGRYGDGRGLGEKYAKPKKGLLQYFRTKNRKLTPEECLPEEWTYMLAKARDLSVAVLQPKNMGPLSFSMLEESIEKEQISFISLKQRIEQLGIADASVE